MRLLEKYIRRSVIAGVLSVTGVLITLFILIDFINELDNIGQHQYTLWHAVAYSLSKIPENIYQLFPLATLLGTMIGLGALARNSELVVIRSSGVSLYRLIAAIMKTALLLIVIAMFIGEAIAPPLHQYVNLKRIKILSKEISLNTDYGLWARDGKTFIHVRRITNKGQLQDVSLYNFDDNQQLKTIIRANHADYENEQWQLTKVTTDILQQNNIVRKYAEKMPWDTMLDPQLVNVVSVFPEMLPIWKLDSYIGYLQANGLDASQYELALWGKLVMPITILAMVLISIPFVFVSQRQTPVGQQILIGFMVGISFFILNKLMGQMGIVYQLHPSLVASVPTLLIMVMAIMMLRRVQ